MANKELPREVTIALDAADKVRARVAEAEAESEEDMYSKKKVLAGLATATSPNASDLQSQALAMLIQSLSEDMEEKRAKKAEKEMELRRLLDARAQGIKTEKANRAATQAYCNHLKENGRTRLGGQKLSNNHLSLMCGFCYKEYDETTVPPHLLPSGDAIGG